MYHLYFKIMLKWHIVSPGLQPRLAILICHILKNQPTKETNWKVVKFFLWMIINYGEKSNYHELR